MALPLAMVVFTIIASTICKCILSIGMKATHEKVSIVSIIIGPDLHAIAMRFIILKITIVTAIFFDISTSTVAFASLKVALVKILRGNNFNSAAIRSILFVDFTLICAVF